ncbi:MAG: nucleotidyl transferase AbiEii/AbiGii toxin family protein [Gammaproteobacteria bacterium]
MQSPLVVLFSNLNTLFEEVSSRWYVFGAQAAIIHGAARLTADVDVTVMYGNRDPDALLQALKANGFETQTENAVEFIRRTRVLPVVHSTSSMPVDIVFGGPGLEEEFVQRSRHYDIEGVKVPVVSAEDLVTMKILSGRVKDLEDVSAILAAQFDKLDLLHIRSLLGKLEAALDRSDLLPVLKDLVQSKQ